MAGVVHVVCPGCAAINRVPGARLGEAPVCGQCRQTLYTGQPVELTGANFRRFIDRNDLPVAVDFWAAWCGPCRAMAPEFAAAARELEPGVRLARLDTDAAPDVAGEFAIRSIPTLIVFKSGREVARHAGAVPAAEIIRWVRAHA